MFDRRLLIYFNWGFFGLVLSLVCVGIVTLYSAVAVGTAGPPSALYIKQITWYGIGLFILAVVFMIDYRHFDRWAYVVYGACLMLLGAVLLFGRYGGGSKRWLGIGPVHIQPSELVKIAVVFVLAHYYSRVMEPRGLTLRELIKPIILVGLPFVLIVKQPDLGTAMLVVLISASITVFVKIEWKTLIFFIFAGAGSAAMAWLFFLEGYQKQRIMTFLDPDRDPLGTGYHIIQSKIAVGSGRIVGKGLFQGTQNTLSFIPEQHTDFIFSVWAEEVGFIGAACVVLAFMILIIWGLRIAHECRDPFGTILSVGVAAMIFWQVVINIGMIMGLMPVVGMPLPFISYGGSSIVAVIICVGILLNVSTRRFITRDGQGIG